MTTLAECRHCGALLDPGAMSCFACGRPTYELANNAWWRDGDSRDSVPSVTGNGTARRAVPSAQSSDLRMGQRDTRDTPSQEAGPDLLAGLRTGAWLDGQTFAPLRYAVPGVLPEGFTVLAGPPKAGKSWLLLATLLAVSAGGVALGQISTGAPRRVLYLALEDGDRRMQDRCRQLLARPYRPDEAIPPLFTYLTRIEPGTVVATVEQFLDRHPDTGLVVIDTLGKVLPPPMGSETAYSRDYRVGGRLKAIADAHPGLSVTAAHHDRKAATDDFVASVSGTNGLAGSADTVIVLGRRRQSRDGLLMVTGRDVPEGEYAIKMAETGAWELDGRTLDEAAARARQRAEASEGLSDQTVQILAFVRDAGEASTGDVCAKFGENARRYLARLADDGRLVRTGRGRYSLNSVPTVPMSQSQVSDGSQRDSAPNSVPTGHEDEL